jgi:hypothetical protein
MDIVAAVVIVLFVVVTGVVVIGVFIWAAVKDGRKTKPSKHGSESAAERDSVDNPEHRAQGGSHAHFGATDERAIARAAEPRTGRPWPRPAVGPLRPLTSNRRTQASKALTGAHDAVAPQRHRLRLRLRPDRRSSGRARSVESRQR